MDNFFTLIAFFLIYMLTYMIIIMTGWILFMIPIFGLKALTIKQTFGFMLLANTFKTTTFKRKK